MAIRDWFYKPPPSSAIYEYPELEGELSIPAPDDIDPATGLPRRIDMSGGRAGVPVQVAQRTHPYAPGEKKTGLGRALMDVLPRALEAGIAGAATPNIAGGGPTDFFRAMQSGRQQLDARDANRLAMMREAQEQQFREDQRQQQYALNAAHADLYQAQAAKARIPEKTAAEKYAEYIRIGFSPEQAKIAVTNGPLQDKSAVDPHKGMTYLPANDAFNSFAPGQADAFGGKWVDNAILKGMMEAPKEGAERTPRVWAVPFPDQQETRMIRENPDAPKGFDQVSLGPGTAPGRPPERVTPERPPGVRDFTKELNDYNKDIAALAKERDKVVIEAKAELAEAESDKLIAAGLASNDPLLRQKAAVSLQAMQSGPRQRMAEAQRRYNSEALTRKAAYDEAVGMLRGAAAAQAASPIPGAAKPKPKPKVYGAHGLTK